MAPNLASPFWRKARVPSAGDESICLIREVLAPKANSLRPPNFSAHPLAEPRRRPLGLGLVLVLPEPLPVFPSQMAAHLPQRADRRPAFFILQAVLLVRLINASWLQTFFQPDEYFQSLEPAWDLAFGPKSGAWLTWEWQHQLRSSIHPALFSTAYLAANAVSKLLPSANVIRVSALLAAPRTLQALFAALGDWYTWRLTGKLYPSNGNISLFALFLQLFSPWQWYCSTRTFSNSLETTLTIMALYYWPWEALGIAEAVKENVKSFKSIHYVWRLRLSLCLAALAVVLRPTNVLIWFVIGVTTLSRVSLQGPSPLTGSDIFVFVREAILCGSLVLGISSVSDYLYFGFWTFPPYNWLNFNISQSLAVFYGRNPWHYYILQGLPLLCTTSLPFALYALYKPAASSPAQANVLKTLSYTVYATTLALSLISHKEVRFIYPLLPILNVLSAPLVASFFTASPSSAPARAYENRSRIRHKNYAVVALGINIFLALFLSFLHQPAPLSVLSYLRGEYERIHPTSAQLAHATRQPPKQTEELFALFLMPCHSTPWRSHLVYPGLRAYALSCEPPLHTQPNTPERVNYRDEADRFYDAPMGFLTEELFAPDGLEPPRYIAGFEGIEPWLKDFQQTPRGKALGMNIRRVWGGFNGFFNEDWRRAGRMMVWDTGIYSNLPQLKQASA
ncbi:GPI mannosyltransferase [Paramyrothecium foliicola]|nr:GPI mannosyltransferase [Paramyrothecium foliicola]